MANSHLNLTITLTNIWKLRSHSWSTNGERINLKEKQKAKQKLKHNHQSLEDIARAVGRQKSECEHLHLK